MGHGTLGGAITAVAAPFCTHEAERKDQRAQLFLSGPRACKPASQIPSREAGRLTASGGPQSHVQHTLSTRELAPAYVVWEQTPSRRPWAVQA